MFITAMLLAASTPTQIQICEKLRMNWNTEELVTQTVNAIDLEDLETLRRDPVRNAEKIKELRLELDGSSTRAYRKADHILALMVAHKCTNLPTEPFRTYQPEETK